MVPKIPKFKPKPKVEQTQAKPPQSNLHKDQTQGGFRSALQQARVAQQNTNAEHRPEVDQERRPQNLQKDRKPVQRGEQRDDGIEEAPREDGDTGSTRRSSSETHERVTEKQDSGSQGGGQQQDQGQGQGGQQGQGDSGYGKRGRAAELVREHDKSRVDLQSAVASEFQKQLLAAQDKVPNRFDPQAMQQLLNKLVQCIRVGKDELGAAVLELGLHAEVFKGLQLRLKEKGGRVAITFSSGDRDVRELFIRERARITRGLEERGLDVDIDVVDIG